MSREILEGFSVNFIHSFGIFLYAELFLKIVSSFSRKSILLHLLMFFHCIINSFCVCVLMQDFHYDDFFFPPLSLINPVVMAYLGLTNSNK